MDLAIATMTRARDRAEERLVAQALGVLNGLGVPVAVCDGGSSSRFLTTIGRLRHVVLATAARSGLVPQVRAAVEAARRTGCRWVFYTESDKLRFFERNLTDFLAAARRRRASIVLASRSRAALATFPEIQRLAEASANGLCHELIGMEADYFYGPFLFDAALAPIVADAPVDLGWGWRPYVFAVARRCGASLAAVKGDYACPRHQRKESSADRAYRIRQMTDNVRGLLAAVAGRAIAD